MVRKRDKAIWSCSLGDWEARAAQQAREEALKARELGLVEDARALAEYLQQHGCSQEEAARHLGRSGRDGTVRRPGRQGHHQGVRH